MPPAPQPSLQSRYKALLEDLDKEHPAYLKARRFPKTGAASALDRLSDLADQIGQTFSGPDLEPFLTWLQDNAGPATLTALNAGAFSALRAGLWQTARTLANSVNDLDHHDLAAQRLADAADARQNHLELPVDQWLKGRFCPAPFEQIETRSNRAVHFCCSAWQPVPIGTLDQTPLEAWNSPTAQEIRRSILEGDYSYCSRWHCPMISGRRLSEKVLPETGPGETRPLETVRTHRPELRPALEMAATPKRAILSHDRSCNLSCPSCRKDVLQLKKAEAEKLDDLVNGRYADFLSKASKIKVTGSGDPFASRHFLNFLKHFTAANSRKERLQLHTNGLLLDEATWNRLDLWGHVDSIWISIDAARANTYASVRRGGRFDQLLANLRFLGDLRRAGAYGKLRLDFVVQQSNYAEIPAFVSLAQHVGANGVYFLRLRNWGTFDAATFKQMSVCEATHPEHGAFLEVLADQRLTSPFVELGSLQPFVDKARCLTRSVPRSSAF